MDLTQAVLESLGCKSNGYFDCRTMEGFHSIPKSFSGLGERMFIPHREVFTTLCVAGHISGTLGASDEVPSNLGINQCEGEKPDGFSSSEVWEDWVECSDEQDLDEYEFNSSYDHSQHVADRDQLNSEAGNVLYSMEDVELAMSEPAPYKPVRLDTSAEDIPRLRKDQSSLPCDWALTNEDPTGPSLAWFPLPLREALWKKRLPDTAVMLILLHCAKKYAQVSASLAHRFVREKYPKLWVSKPPKYKEPFTRLGIPDRLPPPSTRGEPPRYGSA